MESKTIAYVSHMQMGSEYSKNKKITFLLNSKGDYDHYIEDTQVGIMSQTALLSLIQFNWNWKIKYL